MTLRPVHCRSCSRQAPKEFLTELVDIGPLSIVQRLVLQLSDLRNKYRRITIVILLDAGNLEFVPKESQGRAVRIGSAAEGNAHAPGNDVGDSHD